MTPDFFIVAGEASADLHAAALVRELRRHYPQLTCFGVGGAQLAEEGLDIIVKADALNVVGGLDWADKVREVFAAFGKLKTAIKSRRPTCAILLDLPDFNLRMAANLKKLGIPVIYYISPQVWAWRKYRVGKIKKLVDKMLVVFPFEKEFYRQNGVEVEFVGHPLLETLGERSHYRSQSEVLAAPRIGLLPGSRKSELKFHTPILRELVAKLHKHYPMAEFRLPMASTLDPIAVQESFGDLPITCLSGQSREVMAWADFAVVASGTATLETALVGTPFCLFYKVTRTSAWIFQYLVRYRSFIGMPNLLHGREVVREFFQKDATADVLLAESIRLIEDEKYRQEMAVCLRECRGRLGNPGASQRAANQISGLLSPLAAADRMGFPLAESPTSH